MDQLTSLGYRVIAASSGAEALEMLRHDDQVDLLFTDVVMPGGLNGFDLAREASVRWPSLRILLTSGFAGYSAESQGNLPPMVSGMLRKPYRREALAYALHTALN